MIDIDHDLNDVLDAAADIQSPQPADETVISAQEAFTEEPQIKTSLFTITFHTTSIGENDVCIARSMPGLTLFNVIDQLVTQLAGTLVDVQATLFGAQAVVDEQCPRVQPCFDDSCKLRPEFHNELTPSAIAEIESQYALVTALTLTISAMAKARADLHPHIRARLQFGWAEGKQITDFAEAVAYRMKNSPKRAMLKQQLENERLIEQGDTSPMVSAAALLKF